MSVDRAEIAEPEALEQIAILQDTLLYDIACLLHRSTQCGQRSEGIPYAIFEAIVVARSGDAQQIVLERAHVVVDRHIVVVENDQQICLACTRIIQTLECQTARHRSVANHRNHVVLLALEAHSLGHTQRCRDRHRRVTAHESVETALAAARETAQTSQLTIGGEGVAALGDDLMGVGLVSNVPNQLIIRRIENVVDCRCQLHRTQTRTEMTGIYGALLDDVASQFVAIACEFVCVERAQIGRRVDLVEIFILFRFH